MAGAFFRFLCSYRVLLSIFIALLFALICEAGGLVILPRPRLDHPASLPVYAFHDLSIYVIPISTLWSRILAPRSAWICKHALLWAIVMMCVSVSSFSDSMFCKEPIIATFLHCIIFPLIWFSISFLFVHIPYSIICFIYRCRHKPTQRNIMLLYAICVSYIFLTFYLLTGNCLHAFLR